MLPKGRLEDIPSYALGVTGLKSDFPQALCANLRYGAD